MAVYTTLTQIYTKHNYLSVNPYFMIVSASGYTFSHILTLENGPLGNDADSFHKA